MATAIWGSSLYTIVEGPNWDDAQLNAESLGGDLASINNAEENSFIAQEFSQEKYFYDGDSNPWDPDFYTHFWLGGVFNRDSLEWEWISGQEWEFDYFLRDHPVMPIPNDSGNPEFNYLAGIFNVTSNYPSGGIIHGDGPGTYYWDDGPNDYGGPTRNFFKGIAEIPLNLSITTSDTPTEGAGVFTTSINLSAGSETSGNLAEGAEVFWSISGIDADDLESGALAGSGVITDGKLDIDLSLIQDEDTGESLEISVFSDADRNYQIGETQSFEIMEGEVDPITGTLGLPGKINLKNQGKTPFVLYGNEDLIFDTSDQDTLINPDTLGFGSNPGETLFTPATKKNGTTFASYEDVNSDGFLDYVVKVDTPMIASTVEAGEQEIVASATTNRGEDLLFSVPNAVLF